MAATSIGRILFQSTLPVRGATFAKYFWQIIHLEFQSTLPVRGATRPGHLQLVSIGFQSTLPVRGATEVVVVPLLSSLISIHAPREGSDIIQAGVWCAIHDFNPRSP